MATYTAKQIAAFFGEKPALNAEGKVKCQAVGCSAPWIRPGHGLYKLQSGQHGALTQRETQAMARFLKPVPEPGDEVAPAAPAEEPAEEPAEDPFARPFGARHPRRRNYAAAAREHHRQRRAATENPYVDTSYAQVTSNCVERLFSSAKLVSTSLRNLHPSTLEMIMILKHNSDLWGIATVAQLMAQYPEA